MLSAFLDRRVWTRDLLPWVLVVAVALVPRLFALDADPHMALGTGFMTDEGWWAHNARQYALFGQWVLDDQNLALYSTPAYTLALGAIYKVLGVGFFQTRLLSALSGALTCIVLYGFLRRRNRNVALATALLLGCSFPMLLHNRVGFTESFQVLFLTLTAISVIQSIRQPGWGAAAGVFMVLSVLAKASSVVMGLIVPVFWLCHWYASRRGFEPRFSWRPVLYCIGGGSLASLALIGFVIVPHWNDVRTQLTSPVMSAMGALVSERIFPFGLPLGLPLNEFFVGTAVLLVGVALLAVNRLGEGIRKVDEVELFSWVWLIVSAAFLSSITYQPFRRFLMLMPPLAILAGIGLVSRGFRIPGAEIWKARARGYRILAACIVAAVLAYYATVGLTPVLHRLTADMDIGGELGLTKTMIRMALWHSVFLGALVVAFFGLRRLPGRGFAVPALVFSLAFLAAEPGRFVYGAFPVHYTIRDASRQIAAYATEHGLNRTALVGNTSDTFALETDLFAFNIRIWKERNSFMNIAGYDRFRPSMAIEIRKSERQSLKEVEANQDRLKLTSTMEIWRQRGQGSGMHMGLFRVNDSSPRVFPPIEETSSPVVD